MTRRLAAGALGLALMFSAVACGGEDVAPNSVEAPAASGDLEGEQYKDVVSDLEAAGFTSVETKKLPDLITGWLTKDGEVEDVKINGSKDFESGDRFVKDAKVIVRYHTFPEKKDEEKDEPSDEPSDEPTEAPAAAQVLTSQNNKDLAAALAVGDNCDPSLGQFANKYEGRTISFNGSVSAMAPHGDYDTRFDILVAPGDKGALSGTGPTFQFRDKNIVSDLNLTGNVPERFGVGNKARFTAEIDTFNSDNCLFFLEPIETKIR